MIAQLSSFRLLYTAIAVASTLCCMSFAEADEPLNLPFVKIGSTYQVILPENIALPSPVKIVTRGGGGWFLVERTTPDQNSRFPRQLWMNFAQVAGLVEVAQ